MGKTLAALLELQSKERQIAQIRGRLRTRRNAVTAQQKQIDQLHSDWDAFHEKSVSRRIDSDRLELDLKSREEQVSKLRASLNNAKTNKEYAAILTQINTLKADNSKLEEEILKILQETDSVKTDADGIRQEIQSQEKQLEETRQSAQEEIDRLSGMLEHLQAERREAAKAVPPEALAVFDRIAGNYDGDAMAPIQVHGNKPPHTYVCGGCYMSLNAEHANALRVKDEIRTCDNCGRILYLPSEKQQASVQ